MLVVLSLCLFLYCSEYSIEIVRLHIHMYLFIFINLFFILSTKFETVSCSIFLGIIQELDGHLSNLGVKTLYINSFYKSGGVDNGMDIVDYKDVEPSLGTMADVDKLRKQTKDKSKYLLK